MAGLLAIDVGNTQTALGLFESGELAERWRLSTEPQRTGDELGLFLGGLIELASLDGICLSSTVPSLIRSYEDLAARSAPNCSCSDRAPEPAWRSVTTTRVR